jgi:hypothetical protein
MPHADIAAAVDFVRQNIQSTEEMEVLVLLMDPPTRWWDAASVAHALGLDVTIARRSLEHLASRNLLGIRVTNDVRYQFQPGEPHLATACSAFAEAYRTNLLVLLRITSEQPRHRIRAFADAFRIRRDDDR